MKISGRALAQVLALALCNVASAVDGDLDSTFGTGGFSTAGATAGELLQVSAPTVQADGKILICSKLDGDPPSGADFLVVRFTADGMLDTGFSFDGKVTVDFDGRDDRCSAIVQQSDGKIVVVGSTRAIANNHYDFAAARLNSDGSLDATFGNGSGKVILPFDAAASNLDFAEAVALQPDAKIVIAGVVNDVPQNQVFAVVRLLQDGSRDTTFNTTGRATVDFGFGYAEAGSVFVDGAGNIVVGGSARTASGAQDFALASLTPNGQLNPDFNADGRATLGFAVDADTGGFGRCARLLNDGKIVMTGAVYSADNNRDIAVARMLPDGSLDSAFGDGGKVIVPVDIVPNGNDLGLGIIEDGLGRLVVAGFASFATPADLRSVALRLLGDGTLDQGFGVFGKKIFNFGGTGDSFFGVALQGSSIIVGGQKVSAAGTDDLVARLEVDLIFANGFE